MRSLGEYVAMLYGLLPRGIIWRPSHSAAGSGMDALMGAHAVELCRVDSAGWRLIDEIDPQSTVEAIDDWERILGLPDACGSDADTLEERRHAVLAKLLRPAGQDIPFFEALAGSLGYADAKVETFAPFCVESHGAEDHLNDAPGGAIADFSTTPPTVTQDDYNGWRFVWLLRVPATAVREFGVEVSGAEDHLRTWGDAKLECYIRRAAPAHTLPLFGYGPQEDYYAQS